MRKLVDGAVLLLAAPGCGSSDFRPDREGERIRQSSLDNSIVDPHEIVLTPGNVRPSAGAAWFEVRANGKAVPQSRCGMQKCSPLESLIFEDRFECLPAICPATQETVFRTSLPPLLNTAASLVTADMMDQAA